MPIAFRIDCKSLLKEVGELPGEEKKYNEQGEEQPGEEAIFLEKFQQREPPNWEDSKLLKDIEKAPLRLKPLLWKHAALVQDVYNTGKEDFTFYLKRNKESPQQDALQRWLRFRSDVTEDSEPAASSDEQANLSERKPQPPITHFDCSLKLFYLAQKKSEEGEVIEQEEEFVEGRALVCACFEGEYWSLTFRKKGKRPYHYQLASNGRPYAFPYASEKKPPPVFLNTIPQIGDTLYGNIFQQTGREYEGLVVITGRTASAKSKIARRLVYQYLTEAVRVKRFEAKQRRPHLVTFEDPIEDYYLEQNEADGRSSKSVKSPEAYQRQGIDYTPRQKGKDAASLDEVLTDALRQTPTVVYIGETRESDDWKRLLEFAGTGHLIFTTAHAGSLTEAMGKIIEAVGKETPARRSMLADRLLAVVHIRNCEVEGKSKPQENAAKTEPPIKKTVLIPNLWRKTPSGSKAFMAEGRASLLPFDHDEEDTQAASNKSQPSSIGRKWFARNLGKAIDRDPSVAIEQRTHLKNNLMAIAIEWDLEEM